MSYFLKKTHNAKGTYLQIYESYYNPSKKYSSNHCYQSIGYVHELIEAGIHDPIAHFTQEVNSLNFAAKQSKEHDRFIQEETPEKYVGHFLLKRIHDQLDVQPIFQLLQKPYSIRCDVFECLSSLVYARVLNPCSKHKTFFEILPKMLGNFNYSKDQMYDCLSFLGKEYEKLIELYNTQLNKIYPFNVSNVYFDCTNYYFEIDQEDDFRKRGPSKENRRDPIIGMGLLLDANQIPIGMKLYPGNQSEKPILKYALEDLKNRYNVKGRVIRVADKGLNCADNIANALENGDGYLFSKSIKQLPEIEKEWIMLNDYTSVYDENGKELYRYKSCIDEFQYQVPFGERKVKRVFKEKRLVTFNPSLARKKREEIYRQVEKARKLCVSHAKKSEFGDCSKYIEFKTLKKDKQHDEDAIIVSSINEEKVQQDLAYAGYNLLVTSELHLDEKTIYDTYHHLWQIEETFKLLKTDLKARPVYLQKEETIIGHFFICYISILLLRILQFRHLKGHYHTNTIIQFIRDFRVVKMSDNLYLNITKSTNFINDLCGISGLPLNHLKLTTKQLEKVLKQKL